jgi:hypothetical protein
MNLEVTVGPSSSPRKEWILNAMSANRDDFAPHPLREPEAHFKSNPPAQKLDEVRAS